MRLVVLGGGESGVGTAILGKKKGYDVFVSDFGKIKEKYQKVLTSNDISWEEEQHTEALILNADVIMKSPGIPEKVAIVKKLVEKGIPVISEIEFAAPFTKATTIGITGSNGKTTTTMLTYHLLKLAGLNVALGGNVGESFARKVASRVVFIDVGGRILEDCSKDEFFNHPENRQARTKDFLNKILQH